MTLTTPTPAPRRDTDHGPDQRPASRAAAPHPAPRPQRWRRVWTGVGAALALLLVATMVVAFAQSRENGAVTSSEASRPDGAQAGQALAAPSARRPADSGGSSGTPGRTTSTVQQRAVVSTGSVALAARDLDDVRHDVDALLARYGGQVADERTTTDDEGRPTSSRLTLRVPADRFDDVMTALAGTARLRSADRSSTDVSTRVIDVQQQVKAQEAGLARLRTLLRTSSSLSSLLQVEQEVTRRQGELDSLKQQQAYLADQTSMSTITLSISRVAVHRAEPAEHRAGFLTGLEHGWTAFVTVVAGLSVVLGALLPFLVLLLVLVLPARWLWRRRRAATVAG